MKTKIILDVFGCDREPLEILWGACAALEENSDLELVLSGDADIINQTLRQLQTNDTGRIEVIDAKEVITNDESPTAAIRAKKNSSLVKAIEALKEREDIKGMVSAGSTGAVLAASTLKLGRMEGVMRPALAPILPTVNDKQALLIDCGANVDCKSDYLVQFALMGVSYMRAVFGIQEPRVALVSLGTEDKKGNELTKETFVKLKELPINFVGNMEARDALSGNYDVLVCDGFTGNVLLKSLEGAIKVIMSRLKSSIAASGSAKFGYLFMKKAFKKLKNDLDYNAKGGAPLLGVEKIVVKSHGSSDRVAIKAALLQTQKIAQGGFIDNLKQEIKKCGITGEV